MSGQDDALRLLGDRETRVFKMLETWEALVDCRRYCASFEMDVNAVEALIRADIAKPLKIARGSGATRRTVWFELTEFAKYLDYACNIVGFHVSLDGEVTTQTGLRLMIPFAPPPPSKSESNRK